MLEFSSHNKFKLKILKKKEKKTALKAILEHHNPSVPLYHQDIYQDISALITHSVDMVTTQCCTNGDGKKKLIIQKEYRLI